MPELNKKRILLVDDNKAIHEDFKKILHSEKNQIKKQEFDHLEQELFGAKKEEEKEAEFTAGKDILAELFTLDSAYQGEEALQLVKSAVQSGKPYSLAFVDIRMPPGWDGIVTIQHLWEVDPYLQVVICTAYADYSWKEILQKLHNSSNYLILKKPFDVIEIRQITACLTKKWELSQQVNYQLDNLQKLVEERTVDLEKNLSLMKATLEATPEGIIAIGKNQKVMTYNNTFLKLWNISEENLKNEKAFTIFQQLAKEVENSKQFLKIMVNLSDKPEMNADIQEWNLKNGKVIEHHIEPQYLHHKVIGSVFSFRDVTERKELEKQLLYQATHDSLTGFPNRLLMTDRLQQAIVHAKREARNVGILMLDLDNFKEVNDSLGHSAGDLLLKIAAEQLGKSVRDIDTVARLGGDEFIIILVLQSNEDEVRFKAKELLEIFNRSYNIEGHELITTASIGISLYPRDSEDPTVLIKNADAALYYAKELGKNNYQVFQSGFNDHLLQRAELLTLLRKAVEKNQLLLYYQPLIKSDTSKIIGVEALLRWQHPTFGLLFPHAFIELAEESGLIVSIGEWVLRKACQQIKIWQETINPELTMAVNIAGFQFIQKDFVETIKNIINETGINAKSLELEMTESQIFNNVPNTLEKMRQLKAIGIRLAIDDFGTGYASFSYLKYFPFDKVKIDKSFIRGIHLNNSDDAIVEAIIGMTKKMGIEVLAEGVENPEQIAFLMSHHGNQMQGFYYSPPLTEQQCTALLKKEKLIVT